MATIFREPIYGTRQGPRVPTTGAFSQQWVVAATNVLLLAPAAVLPPGRTLPDGKTRVGKPDASFVAATPFAALRQFVVTPFGKELYPDTTKPKPAKLPEQVTNYFVLQPVVHTRAPGLGTFDFHNAPRKQFQLDQATNFLAIQPTAVTLPPGLTLQPTPVAVRRPGPDQITNYGLLQPLPPGETVQPTPTAFRRPGPDQVTNFSLLQPLPPGAAAQDVRAARRAARSELARNFVVLQTTATLPPGHGWFAFSPHRRWTNAVRAQWDLSSAAIFNLIVVVPPAPTPDVPTGFGSRRQRKYPGLFAQFGPEPMPEATPPLIPNYVLSQAVLDGEEQRFETELQNNMLRSTAAKREKRRRAALLLRRF